MAKYNYDPYKRQRQQEKKAAKQAKEGEQLAASLLALFFLPIYLPLKILKELLFGGSKKKKKKK